MIKGEITKLRNMYEDNSSLFFSIYMLAVKPNGLTDGYVEFSKGSIYIKRRYAEDIIEVLEITKDLSISRTCCGKNLKVFNKAKIQKLLKKIRIN